MNHFDSRGVQKVIFLILGQAPWRKKIKIVFKAQTEQSLNHVVLYVRLLSITFANVEFLIFCNLKRTIGSC